MKITLDPKQLETLKETLDKVINVKRYLCFGI